MHLERNFPSVRCTAIHFGRQRQTLCRERIRKDLRGLQGSKDLIHSQVSSSKQSCWKIQSHGRHCRGGKNRIRVSHSGQRSNRIQSSISQF
jgi:hypothetical protein